MRLAYPLVPLLLAASLSGCLLYFDDDDDRVCAFNAEPAAEPAPLRNPETLTCESFGYGCDPSCGPCPAAALALAPSWGLCGGGCDGLAEDTCTARADCRVVKDARCAIDGTCETDFLGCYPTDQFTDSIDCRAATDGQRCSMSAACTAFHSTANCLDGAQACAQPFAFCMPEGQSPGRCHDPVTCRALPPSCRSGTTPGVDNDCYTGACIPDELCELLPNQ